MKKKTPWPLSRVIKTDRNALGVFVTLQRLAGGRRYLTTGRMAISELTGLSPKQITRGMNALADAGWIVRKHGRHGKGKGVRIWYRVTLVVAEGIPWPKTRKKTARSPRGQKRPLGARYQRPKMAPRGADPRGQKWPFSSKEERASNAPRSALEERAELAAKKQTTVADIEQERMAAIKAHRLAVERGEIEPGDTDPPPWLDGPEEIERDYGPEEVCGICVGT